MEIVSIKDDRKIEVPEISVRKMSTLLFLITLFLVQVIFIFQGVDIGDGGSYANFYQQFFDNPQSVQYSFMFWLSGVIGGLYVKVFPDLGIWGLRLAGVLISTSTIFFAYKLLKNYLNNGYLQLSLFILVLFINNNPKEFYYNNLSAFIYVLVSYFLFLGLSKNKVGYIFLSGAFVALNVFNRIPNILGIGMGAVIFYYGYLHRLGYKKQFEQCLYFISGFLVCIGFILLSMQMMGQLQLFVKSLELVFSMGRAAKQVDGLESSYGMFNLLNLIYVQYKFSIIAAILFFVFVLFIIPFADQIKSKYPSLLVRIGLSKFLFLVLIAMLIMSGKIDNISIIYFMTGICLITAIVIFFKNKNKDLSVLMFLGIFIAVVHPLGSSTGIHTVIIYSLWLAFPITLEYLLTIKRTGLKLSFSGKFTDFYTQLTLSEKKLLAIKKTGIGLLLFACLFYSFFYPYFDRTNRLSMRYSINNKYMRGIYTSKARADALNELLEESSKYVKPNDYVLAYDCMPLYHYLTETRPYLRNPWPWLYQPDVFKEELIRSAIDIQKRPVVIFQIVRTMGVHGGNWPDYSSSESTLNWDLNLSRNKIFLEFLKTNHYKEVWANKAFKILIPAPNIHP